MFNQIDPVCAPLPARKWSLRAAPEGSREGENEGTRERERESELSDRGGRGGSVSVRLDGAEK